MGFITEIFKKTSGHFSKEISNVNSLLFLAITAFYCTSPLFILHGLPNAHDMVFHLFQAGQFDKALHEGFFYPRWVPDSNNGYGSATFIFYSPASYYFVSMINLFAPSLTIAMITAIWSGFFLSGITMFMAAMKIFGRAGSLLAAVTYQILPFHLWDLYLRGTLAELFSFIWLPLIILFMHNMFESKSKIAAAGLSVSYAGLILTHLVSGFIFTFVAGAYLIYNYFLRDKKALLRPMLSLLLGLGLSSFYLIPAIAERKFVHIEYITNCTVGDYRKNFLFSLDNVGAILESFYLKLNRGAALEAALFLFIVLIIRENRHRLSDKSHQNFFIFLFISAFLLTVPLSKPLWSVLPGFSTLQFPWRWMPVMELSLSLLIGFIFSLEGRPGFRAHSLKKRVFMYLFAVFSIVSLLTISRSSILSDEFLAGISNPEKVMDLMEPPIEYTPVWVKDIGKIMSEKEPVKVSVLSGIARADVVEWKSEKRVIHVNALTPVLLRISTFYYPGWNARLNGKDIPVNAERSSGAMVIESPAGEHVIELRFADTPARRYMKIISLVSFLIVTAMVLRFFYKRYRNG